MASTVLEVERVPCLSDNYVWLVHDPQSNQTAVVDPAEVEPVVDRLKHKGWNLDYILNTHHHWDHTGGNLQLKSLFPKLKIVGALNDKKRIPGIDITVQQGDTWSLGNVKAHVFETPGHTVGHIAYWFPEAESLFVGDTLFALGCGRLFEGTPEQMWDSLSQLVKLPDSTKVYCAHEYTQSNANFAVAVDPTNKELQARKQKIDQMRAQNLATVPSLLGEEKITNPFLRPSDPEIRKKLGFEASAPDSQVFGAIRRAKDGFPASLL